MPRDRGTAKDSESTKIPVALVTPGVYYPYRVIEPNRWKDVSRLYAEALRQPSAARAAFLRQACDGDVALRSEVESLLSSDAAAGDFMASPAAAELVRTLEPETVSLVGHQLGSYRIDGFLGAGGMGEVYRATDTA